MQRIYYSLLCLFLFVLSTVSTSFSSTQIIMGAGASMGVYYPLGKAISKVLVEKHNGSLQIKTQATRGSGENIQLIHDNKIDISFTQNVIAHYAFNGEDSYQHKMTNMRAIGRLYSEYVHVVANKNSGIKSISDFKGKKISVGIYGSGNERNCRKIFLSYGVDYNAIHILFLTPEDTIEQFRSGNLDAFIVSMGTQNSIIRSIVSDANAIFIPMDGARTSNFVARFPYFIKAVIPAGTYYGQDKDVPTLSVQAILIVRKDLSEELVYSITKVLFENIDEIAKGHSMAKEINLVNVLDGVTIPTHAGASRYFKEKGIIGLVLPH